MRRRAAAGRNATADWAKCWSGLPEPGTRRKTRAASPSGRKFRSRNAPRSWTSPGDRAVWRWRCDATRAGQTNGGARFPRSIEAGQSTQRSDEFVDLFQLVRNRRSDPAGSVLHNACQESLVAPVPEFSIEVFPNTGLNLRGLELEPTIGQGCHRLLNGLQPLRGLSSEIKADPDTRPTRIIRAQPDGGVALIRCPGLAPEH